MPFVPKKRPAYIPTLADWRPDSGYNKMNRGAAKPESTGVRTREQKK